MTSIVAPEENDWQRVLDRARRGDEEAFRVLWRELNPRLLRYLSVRCRESADDVASETWLHVVRDLPRFAGGVDGFRGWLFTVARNRAIDAARRDLARPAVLVPDLADLADHDGRSPIGSAEAQAMERMSTERALALVATLPDEQAELVMLRVVAGLDVATVAAIVGKTPGAVRVSVHRGLRTLSRQSGARSMEAM